MTPSTSQPERVGVSAVAPRRRLPGWLRANLAAGDATGKYQAMQTVVAGHRLHTVCQSARCPNIHDCWGRGTATFMVAGNACTRTCRFCAVPTLRNPPPPDPDEPDHLAAVVAEMALAHVVITVVNRDDLPLHGAAHYRRCLDAVHSRVPQVTLELLSSDLGGDSDALAYLVDRTPLSVFGHNVECVPRLDRAVRDRRASFAQSVAVLQQVKRLQPALLTKSSLMTGLGETDAEVTQVIRQLRDAGVDIVTLGQYLAPTFRHHPVHRYVAPEQFDSWGDQARSLGFKAVASGPLVRSSYQAGRLLQEARAGHHDANIVLMIGSEGPIS